MNSQFTRKWREVTYIHYGASEFDPYKFSTVRNRPKWIKPIAHTGIWASPIDAERGWKDWCEAEDFRECDEDNAFKFIARDPDKIFFVDSKEAYEELIKFYGVKDENWIVSPYFIDYEKMLNDGWDGLEISITDYPRLYDLFYGWDCDSVLIFTKEAIVTDYEDEDNIIQEFEARVKDVFDRRFQFL